MPRHRWVWMFVATTAVVAVAAWGWTWAQPRGPAIRPQQLHPADAIAYLQYDGTTGQEAAWKQTAAYEALVESGLWDAAQKWIAGFAGENRPAQVAQAVALRVLTHGASLSVTTVPGDEHPQPAATLVLHDGATLKDDVAALLAVAGAPGETATIGKTTVLRGVISGQPHGEWTLWTAGEHLIVTFGAQAVERTAKLIDGAAPDITQARLWKQANAAPQGVVLNALGWVDMQQLRRSVGEVSLKGGDSPFETVDDLLEVLGLGGVQELVAQQGFEGRNCWSQSLLNSTGPRTGLMEMFGGQPFKLTDLPPIPERTTGLYAMSFDLTKLYDAGWQIVRTVTARLPNGEQELAKMEAGAANFEDRLGLKIRDDFLAGFGSLHVVYGDTSNTFGGIGVGLALQVQDAAKIRKVFDVLTPLIPDNPNGPRFARTKKRGREYLSFGQPGVPFWPTAVVEENWLFVGITPQVVDSALLRLDGRLPRWQPDEQIQAALAGWPEEYLSLTVSDPRTFVTGVAQMTPFLMAGLQTARQQAGQNAPLPEADFPAAELIAQPLFPNVSVCTVEDGRIVWRSRSSVPGVPLIGGMDGPSVGTSAVLVALLLPAVQQARQAARRTQSRNNMKQQMLALHNYHDRNNEFPAGTVVGSAQKPEDRLSWMGQILPYLDQDPLYRQLDPKQGWNQGPNQQVADTRLTVFLNPQSPTPPQFRDRGYTDYVGVAGLGVNGPLTKPGDKGAGLFAYDHPRRMRDVTDGTSNTIMIGEVSQNVGPWLQGGSATIRPFTQKPYLRGPDGYGGVYPGGAHFGLGDGSVRFISDNIDPRLIEGMTTIQGSEILGDF